MQLLVSVSDTAEALAALAGGADLIDAKDPFAGALEPVSVETLGAIYAAIARERPVTAALGDAADEAAIESVARDFAAAGAAFVKVGFAGIASAGRASSLVTAAARGARQGRARTGVVAVAYADADRVGGLPPPELAEVAAAAGIEGFLIDTADKDGPGLCSLVEPSMLAAWVAEAHAAGLVVALAGKLKANDLRFVRDIGADIAGVRGAACKGGRRGQVTAGRVRLLRERCVASTRSAGTTVHRIPSGSACGK